MSLSRFALGTKTCSWMEKLTAIGRVPEVSPFEKKREKRRVFIGLEEGGWWSSVERGWTEY